MRCRTAAIAIMVTTMCVAAWADEEERTMNGVPWPQIYSENLPMERGPVAENPSAEPFEQAGFVVEEAEWNNRVARTSRFPFPSHSIHNTRLAEFRERYDFLDHIAQGESEFEQLLLMRQWIRQRVSISYRNETASTNPFFILDEAANGRGFVCTQYAALMHACALAGGWTALTVHIDHDHGQDEPSTSHAVADVWVNELAKWVAFDPMYDVHYEKDGVPLSSIELQAEYIRNGGVDVKPVVGVERTEVERARRNRRMTHGEISGYFWNKYVWGWDPFATFGSAEHDMQVSYITEAHNDRAWWQGTPPNNYVLHAIQRGALHQTRRLADVNPDIGVCELSIRQSEQEAAVRVNIRTFLPAFETIVVSVNGGEYEPLEAQREYASSFNFEWDLREGENLLSVRARNEFDRMGPATVVRVVLRTQ